MKILIGIVVTMIVLCLWCCVVAGIAADIEIQEMTEGLLKRVMKETLDVDIKTPIQRITWNEAMDRFGSDKPDIRFGMELKDMSGAVQNAGFKVFDMTLENGGQVKAITVPGGADKYSRKQIEEKQEYIKRFGAKGLAWVKVTDDGLTGPIAKFFNEEQMTKLLKAMDASDNDLLLFVSDAKYNVVCDALAALRNHLGKELKLFNPDEFAFLWVVDFPMFEYDDETERYYAVHHPFTRPKDSDIDKIENDPANCLADAYDIVLNGFELGGGSQRIYEQELQERAFRALGFTQERIDSQFGWFVEAFQYGTPPHGGFALGLDRLAMLLTGSENIREVIAFPKNASAVCPMSKAPSEVDNAQLEELGIAVIEDEQE